MSRPNVCPHAMRTRVLCFFLLATPLLGCPPAEKKEPAPSARDACARIGQTCEVSPGKLGTCVVKDGCTELPSACFVCQSQH